MKKKQKDDVLGEEQSDLPINEGVFTCLQGQAIKNTELRKCLVAVPMKSASRRRHTSISCKQGAQTSLPLLFLRYDLGWAILCSR